MVRPADIETTALGAAYAAGLAVGVWTEDEIFAAGHKTDKATFFHPTLMESFATKTALTKKRGNHRLRARPGQNQRTTVCRCFIRRP